MAMLKGEGRYMECIVGEKINEKNIEELIMHIEKQNWLCVDGWSVLGVGDWWV